MENQRIRVTKRMLKDALVELIQEKSIKKISVFEICELAKVNRTTFYKYYGSQHDLLADMEREVFEELEHRLEIRNNSAREAIIRLAKYVEDDRKKFKALLNSTSDMNFADKISSHPLTQMYMDESFKNHPADQIDYIRSFICNGGYAVLRRWVYADVRQPPEEMANLIVSLVSSLVGKEIT